MGILSRFRRGGADLAAPRPASPSPVELGDDVGSFGGATTTSAVTKEGERRIQSSTAKLTTRIAADMRRHPQVNACLLVQALPLVSAEYDVVCEDDDIREFVRHALALIWPELMRSAARSLWAGYSPNVLVWDVDPVTGGLVVTNVRDLDPATCHALTTKSGRYDGLVQGRGGDGETFVDPLATLWITEGMESGNLYGRSLLTAAHEPWADWQLVRLFELRGLEKHGTPTSVIRYPEGVVDVNEQARIDALAWNAEHPEEPQREVPSPKFDTRGPDALKLGESLKNNSTVALPSSTIQNAEGKSLGYSWTLEYLEAKASTAELAAKLVELNKAIARAIFVPDLVLGDGGGVGSYALGKAHRGVWETSVDSRLAELAGQISRHLVRRLVEFNFGEGAAPAVVKFKPQSDSVEEFWPIVTALVERGELIVDATVLANRVGVPVDEGATEARREAAVEAPPAGSEQSAQGGRVALANEPQAAASGTAWRRPLTAREKRVNLRGVEDGMNAAEKAAVDALVEQLGTSRDKVLRQLAGILRAGGTTAEVITKLATIDVGPAAPFASVWRTLQTDLWTLGLVSVGEELGQKVPERPGADGVAIIRELAALNAERVVSALSTSVRSELIAVVRSGVTAAGAAAAVMDLYDREAQGEQRGARLTTRLLASRAVNEGRADAVNRGGISLRGAQYSAILDRVTCDLCERLDEQLISIGDLDFVKFTPPLHHNCRCVWVYVTTDEADFEPTWQSPPSGMVDKNGSLIVH